MPLEIAMLDTDCPDLEIWQALLDGRLPEPEQTPMLAHLVGCEACTTTLGNLSARWTPTPLTTSRPHGLDDRSAVMLGLLAEGPAPASITLATTALLPSQTAPQAIPEIPGLTDFVEVGHGGMATVFRAREIATHKTVAVKVMGLAGRLSLSAHSRALQEAATLARLHHPHVVQIHRSGMADGVPYLVMEWVDGGTLQQFLKRNPLSPRLAAETVRDLASAVSEAHTLGIIHRDLKPANVLIQSAQQPGERWSAKLADFGLASAGSLGQGLTESGIVMGTPSYMAPEQTGLETGRATVGPATDIHGLGAILYALLTGHPPYEGRSAWDSLVLATGGQYRALPAHRGLIPRDLRTIVHKCLQPAPERRYRAAAELADELDRFLAGKPIVARQISSAERLYKWSRRNPALATATLVLALAALVGIVGTAYHIRSLTQSEEKTRWALLLTDQALTAAKDTRDQFRDPLEALSKDIVGRMMQQGMKLNARDQASIERIRSIYLDWPIEPDPLEALQFRANGLNLIGDLYFRQGQLDNMQACQQAAMMACTMGLSRDPDNLAMRKTFVDTLKHKYDTLEGTPQQEVRLTLASQIVAELENVAKQEPNQRLYLMEALHTLACEQAELGHKPHALTLIAKAVETARQLRQDSPDQELFHYNGVLLYLKLARFCRLQGEPEKQAAFLEAMQTLAAESATKFPNNRITYLLHQSRALDDLAILKLEQGEPQAATHLLRQAFQICQQPLELETNSTQRNSLRQCLFTSTRLLFDTCKAQGQPGKAEPEVRAAIDIYTLAQQNEPSDADTCRQLAVLLSIDAELLAETDRPKLASARYEAAIEMARPWLNQEPANFNWARDCVVAGLDWLSRYHSRQNNHAMAASLIQKRLALSTIHQERSDILFRLAWEKIASGNLLGGWQTALESAGDWQSLVDAGTVMDELITPE